MRPPPAARLFLLGAALLVLCLATAQAAEPKRGSFSGARETVYPDWFKASFLDFEEDIAEAAAAGRRYLLFIHQDGCPYCNRMVEANLAQKDIEATMRKHLDVVELNMWGDREVVTVGGRSFTEKDFARALEVQFTPTLVFFDEQGQVALRLNGYIPPAEFRVALDYVTQRKERELSYRDYVARHAPAAAAEALNPEPFFVPPPVDLSATGTNGKPLAVFFEQADCPNCDLLHREVLTAAMTRAELAPFHAVQLDMWSETPVVAPDGRATTARDWARDLGVVYAPTIVLFAADGSEVIRSEAWFKTFHTASILAYVSSGGYRDEPNFQRYISARAEHIQEQGIDVDLWR
jgi:thioredoxin-related protein